QIIIIAASIQLYPKELYEKGLKVVSACTMRVPPLSLMTQVKSLNYLNNILAKMEALDYGAMEAIMYNDQGFVAEASADNVFVIRNNKIITPPISSGSLCGITRGVIMKLARENGYEVTEENLTRYDMYTVDEIFLTGTGAELIGVIEVDGRKIGTGEPGPITKKLKKTFEQYVRS
ncbi:MAG: branched-chain amino acid aminotransferase, partial [Planctomycetes bacterium]|nr:branched-chain amino acid aminotransferase [Planctomycetota bacterium]